MQVGGVAGQGQRQREAVANRPFEGVFQLGVVGEQAIKLLGLVEGVHEVKIGTGMSLAGVGFFIAPAEQGQGVGAQ